jgi:hypothetical protein
VSDDHDHDHGAVDLDVAAAVVIIVIVVIVDGLDRLLDGDVGPLTAREPRPRPNVPQLGMPWQRLLRQVRVSESASQRVSRGRS